MSTELGVVPGVRRGPAQIEQLLGAASVAVIVLAPVAFHSGALRWGAFGVSFALVLAWLGFHANAADRPRTGWSRVWPAVACASVCAVFAVSAASSVIAGACVGAVAGVLFALYLALMWRA